VGRWRERVPRLRRGCGGYANGSCRTNRHAETHCPADTRGRRVITDTDTDKGSREAEDGRRETRYERLDRNYEELTGELRVVVTGVQVLFAFLLVVPFDTGFAHVGEFERLVYFVTLILATLAAACMIAPSAQHRFLFRADDKSHLVFASNRIAIAGSGFLALAMCGCLLLVSTKLFGVLVGVLTLTFGSAPFAILWFALPLRRRRTLKDRRGS
jgi:Family of unknown function (DUF6328)